MSQQGKAGTPAGGGVPQQAVSAPAPGGGANVRPPMPAPQHGGPNVRPPMAVHAGGQPGQPQYPPRPVQPVWESPEMAAARREAEADARRVLPRTSLQSILSSIDKTEKLDKQVEEALLEIADEFIDSVVGFGCMLARHRKSDTLEAKDVHLHLARSWHMKIPGPWEGELKPYRRPAVNDGHRDREAAVRRSRDADVEAAAAAAAAAGAAAGAATGKSSGGPSKKLKV